MKRSITIALTIVYNIFANYIYFRVLKKKAEKAAALEGAEKEAYIKKYGGTSGLSLFLWIAIGIAIYILVILTQLI